MTTYKELFGKYVQNVSSDPTSTDAEGQIWYNSTSGTFKTVLGNYGVWAAGGNLNNGRSASQAAGTQTAALAVAGRGNPGAVQQNFVESYNGTSWTSSPAINTSRFWIAVGGTTSDALGAGGYIIPASTSTATEKWNGSAWTSSGSLNTTRWGLSGSSKGTSSAFLVFGGATKSPVSNLSASESFNGTSWTNTPSLNTARRTLAGAGTQTAALTFGGETPSLTGATESWNGSTWTTLPASMNTARSGMGGTGTQTAAIGAGGYSTAFTGATEVWNGTSWTNSSSLSTARGSGLDAAGGSSSALIAAGNTGAAQYLTSTEEFDVGVVVPVAGSWSSGGNLNTGKYNSAAGGTQTSTVNFGGYVFPNSATNISESYNGTSWTNTPNMNTARGALAGAGASNTSALAFSGNTLSGSPSYTTATESFNGSSWTNVNSLNTSRGGGAGGGIQTSAIMISGYDGSSNVTNTELWNGTSWTTSPAGVNTAARGLAGVATSSSSALKFGGYSTAVTGATESWNGSSWTSVNSLNTIRSGLAGAGTQTLALAFAGDTGPGSGLTATELWNGTSWTTSPNGLAYARYAPAGSGTQAAALCIGGIRDSASPQFRTNTEAWTGPSTTLNYKTLTTS
jgi:hypothetical protein